MKFQKIFFTLGLAFFIAGCGKNPPPTAASKAPAPSVPESQIVAIDPLTLVLMTQAGDTKLDREIRQCQDKIREGKDGNREATLERLGWLFIAKARESFDPGYYKIAATCADVLDSDRPGCAEGLLLHGCVLENLHHFKEAEVIARKLVEQRGLSFDFGLLGDSLMEQGRLDEAVTAYQSMVDLRPDLESYSRIAHLRWLKGDTDGAMAMMQAALAASSSKDLDPAAWVCTQLGLMNFQAGKKEAAERITATALVARPDYPPALLLRGRMAMAEGDYAAAVTSLETAAQANPLPEYQWALAEALRADDREPEAVDLEARLCTAGVVNDPRTLSLFLATSGQDAPTALRLAEAELQQRQDIFTQDAVAWALAANGRVAEARQHMALALAEGTQDGRLFFHAAIIAQQAGKREEARQWFHRAANLMAVLLPSEQAQLRRLTDDFPSEEETPSLAATGILPAPK